MPVVEIRNYNTNIPVKYWTTEQELLKKIAQRENNVSGLEFKMDNQGPETDTITTQILDDDDDNTIVDEKDVNVSYTKEDVEIICHKLYQDELCSAFNCDTFLDDSINATMSLVFNELNKNEQFVSVLKQIRDEYFSNIELNINYEPEDIDNFNNYLFYMLFSYDVFYIVHQVICQQLTTGDIDGTYILQLYNTLQKVTVT